MDVLKLIKCLENGMAEDAFNYIPTTYSQAIDLKASLPYGWTCHGSGYYSVVIGQDISNVVWKISWRGSDPWMDYAKYSDGRADINPMIPKIFEFVQRGDKAIGRMERLQPVDIMIKKPIWRVVGMCRSENFKSSFSNELSKKRKAKQLLRGAIDTPESCSYNPSNLADIVVWMAGLPDPQDDCHSNNWMCRPPGQLVLIDPMG